MPQLGIRFDMRSADPGRAPELYAAALELTRLADAAGLDFVQVSEHHHAEDGYCPSPLVLSAAFAGCTTRLRLRIGVLVLPLHNTLRVAEDAAVLDLVSGGRLDLAVGVGYRPLEFAMLGADFARRGADMDDAILALQAAWTGVPFQHAGQSALVRPRPLQDPLPLLVGGSSAVAARRAARLGLGFMPTMPDLVDVYRSECARLGTSVGAAWFPSPHFFMVSEDPDRTWHDVGEYLLHDNNAYAGWYAEVGRTSPKFEVLTDPRELRAAGTYQICTPAEAVALASAAGPDHLISLHPLAGGMPVQHAFAAVQLFLDEVLPAVRAAAAPTAPATPNVEAPLSAPSRG